MTLIIYITAVLFSLAGTLFIYRQLGHTIALTTGSTSPFVESLHRWLTDTKNYFLNCPITQKVLLTILLMGAILLLLLYFRYLDPKLRSSLPFGDYYIRLLGNSPLERFPLLRLAPGFLYTIYRIFRFFVSELDPDASFDIRRFSMTGQDYTVWEHITQLTIELFIFCLLLLVFEGFWNVGAIGGLLHAAAVITVNLLMCILAFIITIVLVLLITALAAAIAAGIAIILLGGLLRKRK